VSLPFGERIGAQTESDAGRTDGESEEKGLAEKLRAHEFLLRVPCGTR
jgi:hypothetical protein